MLTPPMSHDRLGLVKMLVGQGSGNNYDGELAAFILEQARAADFSFTTLVGPRPARAMFDDFFRPFGDAANIAPQTAP